MNTFGLMDIIETMPFAIPVTFYEVFATFCISVGILPRLKKKRNLLYGVFCQVAAMLILNILMLPVSNIITDSTAMDIAGMLGEAAIPIFANIALFFIYRSKKQSNAKLISALAISHFFVFCLMYLLIITMDLQFFELLREPLGRTAYYVITRLPIIFMGFGLYAVLKKVKFQEYFASFFGVSWRKDVLITIASILLMLSPTAVLLFAESVFIAIIFFVFSIVVFLVLVIFAAKWGRKTRQIKVQESIIAQQKTYVEMLEGLQQEMRFIQHDFQNIMSGLYLQAEEGDVTGIQNYLKNALRHFDKKIGAELRQTTQIGNIKILGLQSLIIIKLAKIKELGINYVLEVRNPITKIPLKLDDFLRCMGILLDNAIEAAADMENGKIIILFLQEKSVLSISIQNTAAEMPPIHKLSKEGYSSKGKNRGLGLASYHNILEGYANVLTRTKQSGALFLQEIILKG